MNGIEFNILWCNEGQSQLNDLGIRPDVVDSETRPVTFYTIDCIAPYRQGDKEFTTIHSGGS